MIGTTPLYMLLFYQKLRGIIVTKKKLNDKTSWASFYLCNPLWRRNSLSAPQSSYPFCPSTEEGA
jgi:hypothetical protein